ncbi:MAG: hypothetical protein Q9201_003096 [Fulgogasparrea decipioides]
MNLYDTESFFPLFTNYIYTLITTIPSIIHSTNAVLDDFAADGVCYLELRTTPRVSPGGFSAEEYIATILACISTHNQQQNAMRTFLILSVDRKHSGHDVANIIDIAIKYRNSGIVGVDLCGDPSRPISNINMLQHEFGRAKKAGLGLTLHFAEVPESSSSSELEGLLAMQPDRLGHVIHVSDSIKDEIAEQKIGLELCLSCNVHAKLTMGGFADHHFRDWWRRRDRGAVILCTDDVGIFLSPLSQEYLLAAEHFGLSREDLVDLCEAASVMIWAGDDEAKRIRREIAAFRTKSQNQALSI